MQTLKRWTWYLVAALGWPVLAYLTLDQADQLIPGGSDLIVVLFASILSCVLAGGVVWLMLKLGAPRGISVALVIGASCATGILLWVGVPAGTSLPFAREASWALRLIAFGSVAPLVGVALGAWLSRGQAGVQHPQFR